MQSACAVLYCHLWPVRLYHIFPHYLTNGTIFGKKLLDIKCVFCFSLQLLSETFRILRRIQRDVLVFMYSARYSRKILMKLELSRQIFEQCSNIKFHENPSNGSQVVPCGRTGTHRHTSLSNFWKRSKTLRVASDEVRSLCGPTECISLAYL
jgi:hypothetical protein